MVKICSDDDVIYPNASNTSSIKESENNDEKWIFVQHGTDKRPKDLHEFKEKPGPTFSIALPVSPSTFYREMLPDPLFDHLVTCTNARARVYFDYKSTLSSLQITWKPVGLLKNLV